MPVLLILVQFFLLLFRFLITIVLFDLILSSVFSLIFVVLFRSGMTVFRMCLLVFGSGVLVNSGYNVRSMKVS